eukprot:gene42819-44885_t
MFKVTDMGNCKTKTFPDPSFGEDEGYKVGACSTVGYTVKGVGATYGDGMDCYKPGQMS